MASTNSARTQDASAAGFGAWLRAAREAKGEILRTVAAAADMDPSHLGKAERGGRPPTLEQTLAIARHLGLDVEEARRRYHAARLLQQCEGDPALAASVASLVHEHAAPYLTSKPRAGRK